MRVKAGNVTLQCLAGDISAQAGIDAVVNAANAELTPGGGVAGALHAAAGPELALACRPFAPIRPGEAVITEGFGLPNKYVIHCLGPVYGRDEPASGLLARCYSQALRLADEHGLGSIAFPAISTGSFGYPFNEGAEIACRAVADAAPSLKNLGLVRFVLFDPLALELFSRTLVATLAAGTSGTNKET